LHLQAILNELLGKTMFSPVAITSRDQGTTSTSRPVAADGE
jgi:hypothetical protein